MMSYLKTMHLYTVDFTKPWWRIISKQKWLAITAFTLEITRDIFWAVIPFIIIFVLEQANWYIFAAAATVWALSEISVVIQRYLSAKFQLQCIHSILYSAHQYLLTIDPQYHAKRSSGVVLGKIDKAARGYEEVLDQITFEFIPVFVGIIVTFVMLVHYSAWLAIVICLCLMGIIAYSYYFMQYICDPRERAFIKTDDEFRSAAFENLAQVHLIRATFATDYMRDKLTRKITANANLEREVWMTYSSVSRVLSGMYATSVLILVAFFVYGLRAQITTLPTAMGIILAYIQSTRQLVRIFHPLRRFKRGLAAIDDLFNYIPYVGRQTIPVFTRHDPSVEKQTTTCILAENLLFSYGAARLFDEHTLHIETDHMPNNLYGIIGPSGVGKTTLLSILGGQLKPTSGTVLINGLDIYAVGDVTRRQLIALQGQIPTNVKGSVRYNLLFGLPEGHGYTDEYLSEILRRVGLERVLREHQGLDTMLGEGGFNLSGGQRQRLNFAGLYLRATYFKPLLILIDEPTSSLDEISERAVTEMIQELGKHAVTLVIAHRLNTLKNAAGLIDLSLITQSKEIRPHSLGQLENQSTYYRRLLEGKDAL